VALERAVQQAQELHLEIASRRISPGHGQAIPDRFFGSR
jgi:hypothetical protein